MIRMAKIKALWQYKVLVRIGNNSKISYIIGENAKTVTYTLQDTANLFSIYFSYDSEIPDLNIYPREMKSISI